MQVFWTQEALADREAIYSYIEVENPLAALELDERVSKSAARLSAYPEQGRLGRVAGTRELVIHPNYILIYDLKGEALRILRVLHSARRWP